MSLHTDLAHVDALRERVAAFVHDVVIPHEPEIDPHGQPSEALVREWRARAREAGLLAPHVSPRFGGLGLDTRAQSVIFEEAGKSLWGPLALNIAAPDEGNMHLLERVATPAQQERYLRPLAAGEIRSCFAMTEPPPGAGSDPSMLRTTAVRDRDGRWVIDGEKWFITGADGAAFAICMARTGERIDGREGATMFLVDAENPGFVVRKRTPGLDHAMPGGHCEVSFVGCAVDDDAVLGEVGKGYAYAQVRLAPARLTHCMRWLGAAVRALEIAVDYARAREAFGKPLAVHEGVQFMIADSAIELQAARLMIRHAAEVLDAGGQARQETSMAKVFVAETVHRVVDRALQICGSHGIAGYLPLERLYRETRAFRIYDGPSEVHRMAIAERIVRRRGA